MSVLGKRGHREGIQTSLFGMDKNYACGARLILNFGHRSLQESIDALPIHSPMVVWRDIGPCPVSSRQLRGVFVTQPNLMLYNQFLHHNACRLSKFAAEGGLKAGHAADILAKPTRVSRRDIRTTNGTCWHVWNSICNNVWNNVHNNIILDDDAASSPRDA